MNLVNLINKKLKNSIKLVLMRLGLYLVNIILGNIYITSKLALQKYYETATA